MLAAQPDKRLRCHSRKRRALASLLFAALEHCGKAFASQPGLASFAASAVILKGAAVAVGTAVAVAADVAAAARADAVAAADDAPAGLACVAGVA